MTKRSRTLLFLILVAIFVLGAPSIIFYSQGYRFDFESRRFTQVGAFFFDVHPPRAQIYVDEQRIGETSRFVGNTLSKNLLPKTYHVSIQKEDYISWEKNLEIFPRQVTEAKHITLFPKNIDFEVAQENVLDFWIAPNNKDVLLQKSNLENLWTIVLWDTETNIEYVLFEALQPSDEIWNIAWAPNSNSFLLQIVSRETVQAFIQEVNRGMLSNANLEADMLQIAADTRISLPFLDNITRQTQFLPTTQDRLVFLSSGDTRSFILSVFNITNQELEQPLASNVISFAFQGEEFFWLDDQGMVWHTQSTQEAPTKILEQPFSLQTEELHQLYVFDGQVFLETANALYWLNDATKSFENFISLPKNIVVSPDNKKIAISNGKEILLFFLQDDVEQPFRQKNETVLLTRLGQEISQLAWLNSHYLLFQVANTIQVTEIDTRGQTNVLQLVSLPNPRFFWQPAQTRLYILSNNQIQASQDFWP